MKACLPDRRVAVESQARPKSVAREYAEAILIALVLAIVVRTFVVQAFKIPSGSMIPTMIVGDHILVNKFIFGIKNPLTDGVIIPVSHPKRDDVVVFKFPRDESTDFIKRVIGLPGETVEVRAKQVYINGSPLVEPFTVHQGPPMPAQIERDNFGPVVVPEGHYFVMGDNRDESWDSRFWGFVSENKIRGRAFVIYWSCHSPDHWTDCFVRPNLIHWDRMFKVIR